MERTRVLSIVIVACMILTGPATAQELTSASGRLVGGFDVLFLKAYGNSYDQMVQEELSGDSVAPGNNFEVSPRVWFGYVGPSGFGVRSRWFQHQHDLTAGTGTFGEGEGLSVGRNYLDVYAIDLDFMQQLHLGYWDLNGGAGIRAGGVKRSTTIEFVDSFGSRFEGVGPTAFVELKRPIASSGFSLVANARGALLFGNGRWFETLADEASGSDITVGVGEVQLGAEYSRELGYGVTGFAQCVWEGQLWSNATQMLLHRDDLGLMGMALNFGIAR